MEKFITLSAAEKLYISRKKEPVFPAGIYGLFFWKIMDILCFSSADLCLSYNTVSCDCLFY